MTHATTLCWSAAALALVLGAATVCPDNGCHVPEFDRRVLAAMHDLRQPWLDAAFAAATWLGSIAVLLPAALALAWRFRRRGLSLAARYLPLAVLGAWLIAHLGKLLVSRPRPDLFPVLIEMPADLSFPSAHAMQVAAFAFACALPPEARAGWRVVAAAAVLAAVVGLSRLYLQVHYPSDVLSGLLAGAAWAAGLRYLMARRA